MTRKGEIGLSGIVAVAPSAGGVPNATLLASSYPSEMLLIALALGYLETAV